MLNVTVNSAWLIIIIIIIKADRPLTRDTLIAH